MIKAQLVNNELTGLTDDMGNEVPYNPALDPRSFGGHFGGYGYGGYSAHPHHYGPYYPHHYVPYYHYHHHYPYGYHPYPFYPGYTVPYLWGGTLIL